MLRRLIRSTANPSTTPFPIVFFLQNSFGRSHSPRGERKMRPAAPSSAVNGTRVEEAAQRLISRRALTKGSLEIWMTP